MEIASGICRVCIWIVNSIVKMNTLLAHISLTGLVAQNGIWRCYTHRGTCPCIGSSSLCWLSLQSWCLPCMEPETVLARAAWAHIDLHCNSSKLQIRRCSRYLELLLISSASALGVFFLHAWDYQFQIMGNHSSVPAAHVVIEGIMNEGILLLHSERQAELGPIIDGIIHSANVVKSVRGMVMSFIVENLSGGILHWKWHINN